MDSRALDPQLPPTSTHNTLVSNVRNRTYSLFGLMFAFPFHFAPHIYPRTRCSSRGSDEVGAGTESHLKKTFEKEGKEKPHPNPSTPAVIH